MLYRKFGNSDHHVSAIGLGCWQFSGNRGLAGRFWGDMDESTIRSIVQTSLEGKVNWFDTAEMYGGGYSERSLSAALQSLSIQEQDTFIATKWNPVLRFASSIGHSFVDRETNLAPYPIRVLQVHNPSSLSSIEKQMQAMAALVHAGKIEMVGVSNFSLDQMKKANEALKAVGLTLASNQMRYHLLDRSIETNGVLDYARQHGITIIAYSPLAQGLLTGRYHEQPNLIRKRPGFRKYLPAFSENSLHRTQPLIEILKDIAGEHNATPAQVALRWVVQARGENVIAIPGASSAHQAQQNAAVMDLELTSAEIHLLDKISREVSGRP
ncbi:MAG TPA: aldo/keto reductase [Anaerolineaceae bacterium]|nr:aldo/keto reductase [Anaerolineaceae bacterium]